MTKDYRLLFSAIIIYLTTSQALTAGKNVFLLVEVILLISIFITKFINKNNLRVIYVYRQCIFVFLLLIIQSFSFITHTNFEEKGKAEILKESENSSYLVKIKSFPSFSSAISGSNCEYLTEVYLQTISKLEVLVESAENCEKEETGRNLEYNATYKVLGKFKEDERTKKIKIKPELTERTEEPNFLDKFFNRVHQKSINNIKELIDNNKILSNEDISNSLGLSLGMSLGDKRFINKEQNEANKVAGLTHLTAISGTHFVIVISTISLFIGFIRNRKLKAIVKVAFVGLLVTFVHPSDSVKRASLMSGISLFGNFFNRRSSGIQILSIVVLTYLFFDPKIALSLSFALSTVATASIILFSKPAEEFLKKYVGKTAAPLLAIPTVAQFGCYPILLTMNSYLTPYAVFANVFAVPFIQGAAVFSFFGCFLSFVPIVSKTLFSISGTFTFFISKDALIFSHLPFSRIPWPAGLVGQFLIIFIPILLYNSPKLYKLVYERVTKRAINQHSAKFLVFQRNLKKYTKRKKFTAVIVIAVLIITGTIVYFKQEETKNIPANWLIAVCDVGQGDSAVLRTGENSAVLVDVGPENNDTGGEGVDRCLRKLNVKEISLIVLSHYHDDHIGGLNSAIQTRIVKKALVSPVLQPEAEANKVFKTFENVGVTVEFAKNGKRESFGNCEKYCVEYEVVSVWDNLSETGELQNNGSPIKREGKKSEGEDNRENDSSIAILFKVNGIRYFTAGDLEKAGSEGVYSILNKREEPAVDILKVNHHGSKTQNEALLRLLNPKVAVYMVGKNKYGHPNKQTVDFLENLGAKTLRSDTSGITGFYFEDEEFLIFKEKS